MGKVISLEEYKNAKEGIVSPLELATETVTMVHNGEIQSIATVVMLEDGSISIGSSYMSHLELIGMFTRAQTLAIQAMEEAEEELWEDD